MDKIFKIIIKDAENIEKIVKQCTAEDYNSRLSAILENYNTVFQYSSAIDYVYNKYLITH